MGHVSRPGDPGAAPVAVPGLVRLALEAAVFGFAAWALYDVSLIKLSWIWSLIVIAHYAISYDRVLWLLQQRGGS